MAIKREPPDRDGIIRAAIHGTASRHTSTGDPQHTARDAAIAELREAATHRGKLRADLLSQQAGLFTGLGEGEGNEWQCAQLGWMVALCSEAAGDQLDEEIVAEWTAIGRERAGRRKH